METLPDLLGPNLRLILVGINPSLYAVARGHYFARPQNRFWPALSQSNIGQPICAKLGVERLYPEHDHLLPSFSIGLTDVVKIPSSNASFVTPAMYREGAPRLQKTLADCSPKVIAFHGMTGFRPFLKHAMGEDPKSAQLGLQAMKFDGKPIFVLPNPSGANARYLLADLVGFYNELAKLLDRVAPSLSS